MTLLYLLWLLKYEMLLTKVTFSLYPDYIDDLQATIQFCMDPMFLGL